MSDVLAPPSLLNAIQAGDKCRDTHRVPPKHCLARLMFNQACPYAKHLGQYLLFPLFLLLIEILQFLHFVLFLLVSVIIPMLYKHCSSDGNPAGIFIARMSVKRKLR